MTSVMREEQREAEIEAPSRKRLRAATLLHSAGTSAGDTALQAALREIQQLQIERTRQREEYETQLQQRDEEFRRLEERIRQLDGIQISRSNLVENERNSVDSVRTSGNFRETNTPESINK